MYVTYVSTCVINDEFAFLFCLNRRWYYRWLTSRSSHCVSYILITYHMPCSTGLSLKGSRVVQHSAASLKTSLMWLKYPLMLVAKMGKFTTLLCSLWGRSWSSFFYIWFIHMKIPYSRISLWDTNFCTTVKIALVEKFNLQVIMHVNYR